MNHVLNIVPTPGVSKILYLFWFLALTKKKVFTKLTHIILYYILWTRQPWYWVKPLIIGIYIDYWSEKRIGFFLADRLAFIILFCNIICYWNKTIYILLNVCILNLTYLINQYITYIRWINIIIYFVFKSLKTTRNFLNISKIKFFAPPLKNVKWAK